MATDALTSLSELKQLLVTGTNNAAWSGNHLVRHLVDWYQRCERENRNNPAPADTAPEDDSARMRMATPSDSLIYSTSVIPKLVEEGNADVIIDTLRSFSQIPYVDKEALVMCLAVASKQADNKKLVTDAHSAVRELCTNTHLFFLFIQIQKMMSKKFGHSGWGRGLRRAVGEWYRSWEPKQLALEVTRHFSAHGWTHRDVVRLAHLKLKEMPLGTQVVLHYVFMGLDKTVKEYTGKDNTSELLELMQMLDKDGHPKDTEEQWDVDQVINKVNKLHEVYKEVTLDDVPPQSLKTPEVWSHMLDKLDGESAVASVNRMAKAGLLNQGGDNPNVLPQKLVDRLIHADVASSAVTPASALMALHAYEHPSRFSGEACGKVFEKKSCKSPRAPMKAPLKKSTKVNQSVVDALHKLMATSAKNITKTSRNLAVFVDVRGYMSTSHVWTGNPEGKGEVTGHEGAAVIVLSLTSGASCTVANTLAFSGAGVTELPLDEGITLMQLVEKFKETVIGEFSVDTALQWAQEKNMETAVVITHKLDQHAITAAAQSLKQINEKNNTQIRLVLCGLGTKHLHTQRTQNFLLVLGFDQRTPSIIRAYHERFF